jgi:hypothetical protein
MGGQIEEIYREVAIYWGLLFGMVLCRIISTSQEQWLIGRNTKKYTKYLGFPKLRRLYNRKFLNLIHQNTVKTTFYENFIWINSSNLIPKSNGDMRLVVDMRKVNQFI